MLESINETIVAEINPILALHKGSCEAVKFEEGLLSLKLLGGCAGCPSSRITLFNGIAPVIFEKHPEVEGFELV